jgi:hypothetical protein
VLILALVLHSAAPALAAPTDAPPVTGAPRADGAAAGSPASASATGEAGPAHTAEGRISPRVLLVRAAPSRKAPVVGRIGNDAPFWITGRVSGPDCGDGWGVALGGYTCLAGTRVTDAPVLPLPMLVPFDPPAPEEYRAYVKTGAYPRDPDSDERLLPFVYGKAWRHWKGTNYASLAAWERGDPPVETLADDRKYHFEAVAQSERGTVLLRDDGKVVPVDDVFLYPVSRFAGVDLVADPLPEGQTQAWVHGYSGAPVRATPARSGAVLTTLAQQAALRVVATPVTPDGHWYSVPDAGGVGVPGYVEAIAIRRTRPLPPPSRVGPDETWIDVDTAQEVLQLWRGSRLVFATLVSTGLTELATPHGLYRILDKAIYGDMESLPGAPEPYHVENVPWVMHFRPRYALHGVFWHWGFGNYASHGCINLSPRDAARIFQNVAPHLPDGWQSVVATSERPGTTIRVRAESTQVVDRR